MNTDRSGLFPCLLGTPQCAWLVSLRDAVAPILANNLLPHFTDHSVTHSDDVTEIVDSLVKPMQSAGGGHSLNANELFVLYAACYLHDIGLQYERAGQTQVVQRRIHEWGLAPDWETLDEATRRKLLRECHSEIAAEMVLASVRSSSPPIGMQLMDHHLPEYVARLCHAHTVKAPSELYEELTAGAPNLRMNLLSALLRLSDILAETRRRALRAKAQTLDLDLEAQTHWWRHYYTEDVTFELEQRTITLHFQFPEQRREEYDRIVPELQLPSIEEELQRHQQVLNQYGCGWSIQKQTRGGRYGTAETMPDAVEVTMLQQLKQRRDHLEAQQRLVVLAAAQETRDLLDRRLQKITTGPQAAPAVRLREVHQIARDLWQLGSRRSAWMLLWGEYDTGSPALAPEERLAMGCALARMMMEDNEASIAMRTLQHLQPLAEATAMPPEQCREFWEVWATAASTCGAQSEAISGYETLMKLTTEPAAQEELKTRLAEEHFLHGDLEPVTRILDGE